MATRGAPLPIARRLEIQSLARNMPLRLVARVLGVSRNTVSKYAGKFEPPRRNSV